jgi:hypothetical protein
MVSFDERQRRIGLPEVIELEKRFAATDEPPTAR